MVNNDFLTKEILIKTILILKKESGMSLVNDEIIKYTQSEENSITTEYQTFTKFHIQEWIESKIQHLMKNLEEPFANSKLLINYSFTNDRNLSDEYY